ncbi:MAG: hypothetical protein U5K72_01660 [Balneolaceae bacterium]|nr:hypothetical protein [Balneolaceae bacterium]
MNHSNRYKYLSHYLDQLRLQGRYTFTGVTLDEEDTFKAVAFKNSSIF